LAINDIVKILRIKSEEKERKVFETETSKTDKIHKQMEIIHICRLKLLFNIKILHQDIFFDKKFSPWIGQAKNSRRATVAYRCFFKARNRAILTLYKFAAATITRVTIQTCAITHTLRNVHFML